MKPERMLPAERRAWLLRHLRERGWLHVPTLARRLGVSAMTLHRDLDLLVQQGHARKVRGGAVAAEPRSREASPAAAEIGGLPTRCGLCGKPADGRHAFVLHPEGGLPLAACCAHCGLLLLRDRPGTAMVLDFLTGHGVSAGAASYVAAPDLVVCCRPSVLPFSRRADAERFAQGFGGHVLSLREAMEWVRTEGTATG
ncbi:MAG TPA: DeoR family transcriptional regulator [Limnochordales bacterium]